MRKLEELFDMPVTAAEVNHSVPVIPERIEQMAAIDLAIDKIEAALPQVRGLELTDQELDDLSQLAINGYKDLSDLGMQVDSRFAAEIFSVASNMLGHAITAKTAKLDKKLKMIDLQLKKLRLDQTAAPPETAQQGQGQVLSRNDLLQRILAGSDKTGKSD